MILRATERLVAPAVAGGEERVVNAARCILDQVRIGRRRLVTSASPTAGMIWPMATRLCSIDMNSPRSPALNAQASTTCWPFVLTTLTCWPWRMRAALPRRAGISIMPPRCVDWRWMRVEVGGWVFVNFLFGPFPHTGPIPSPDDTAEEAGMSERDKLLRRLRAFRGRLPDFAFDREEANTRQQDVP